MDTLKNKVSDCFLNVFPTLSSAALETASTTTLKEWDSMSHVILLSSIAEAFQLDLEPEDFEGLVSYQRIVEYLEQRAPAHG